MDELKQAFEAMKADAAVRCVILTGEVAASARRQPLGAAPAPRPIRRAPTRARPWRRSTTPSSSRCADYPVPIVTAVNGVAAGVGCSLALMGDIVVAAESAYFLQAFRRIGLVPDGGSTYLLPRLIGKARAMEMALLGDKVPASTALDWGLINRCVPDDQLMGAAHEVAQALATGPKALGAIRQADLGKPRRRVVGAIARRARRPEERRPHRGQPRGRTSLFLQKRPAQFKGR